MQQFPPTISTFTFRLCELSGEFVCQVFDLTVFVTPDHSRRRRWVYELVAYDRTHGRDWEHQSDRSYKTVLAAQRAGVRDALIRQPTD